MKFRLLNFSVLLLAAGLLGCTAGPYEGLRTPDPDTQSGAPYQESPQEPAHPVSLISFMQKEFSGSDLKLGRVLDDNEAYTRYYITYKSGDLTISGIMNVPKGGGPFPVLVLNHGHIDTDVYTNGRGLKREQDYLARRGYVVVHPDYRNHADSDDDPDTELSLRLGYTEDSINAVLAIKEAELPYVDAEAIGMLGHSMGGGITLNTLVSKPDLVKAAVLFAPVSSNYRDNFEKWTKQRSETAAKIIEAYGTPEENQDFWTNISSATFFGNIQAPVVIHHGTNDTDVPIEWSERTTRALESAGKDIKFYAYEGEPHEFISAWPLVMRRTVEFFDAHLKQ